MITAEAAFINAKLFHTIEILENFDAFSVFKCHFYALKNCAVSVMNVLEIRAYNDHEFKQFL